MGSTWSWPPQQSLLYLYCNSGFLGNWLWSIDLCAGNSLGGAVRVNTCGQAKTNRQVEREVVGTLADFMRRQLRGSGAGWPCRVSHPEARRIILYTCALTCHWMSTELDKWALFNWWQCSERGEGRVVSSQHSWHLEDNLFWSWWGRWWHIAASTAYLKKEKAASFNFFTLPCVSLMSMKLTLLVLSSAAFAPRTSPEPMEFKILLFIKTKNYESPLQMLMWFMSKTSSISFSGTHNYYYYCVCLTPNVFPWVLYGF